MIKNLSILFLKFFDYFHKKKIIKYLKSLEIESFNIFFDVGAHIGESIDLFCNNFSIKSIYSFEASLKNYNLLKNRTEKLKKKFNQSNIYIYNLAAGDKNQEKKINQLDESSSSTLIDINQNSKYFRKKSGFLYKKKNYSQKINTNQIRLDKFILDSNIKNIDFIKLDTEGYEFYVLNGLGKYIQNTKYILFEHHYHNMLIKNYSFSDMNNLLRKNNFKKIFKAKMPFRKTFEYIYKNENM